MRKIIVLLFTAVMASVAALAQSALKWQVTVTNGGTGKYTVRAETVIPDGWHVYADDDAELGLEKLALVNKVTGLEKGVVTVKGSRESIIEDPVFDDKKLKVYTGASFWNGTCSFPKRYPAL